MPIEKFNRNLMIFLRLVRNGCSFCRCKMALLPTAREGNVFTGVCHSAHNQPHGNSLLHPCSSLLQRGRYASYWNAFLFVTCFHLDSVIRKHTAYESMFLRKNITSQKILIMSFNRWFPSEMVCLDRPISHPNFHKMCVLVSVLMLVNSSIYTSPMILNMWIWSTCTKMQNTL